MRTVMKRLLLCVLMLSLIGALTGCDAFMIDRDYPQPKITYGEFPFELVYSFEGEITTVKGVYVCEYVGLRYGATTYRKWTGYIQGTDSGSILITEFDDTKIYVSAGQPAKYMGDAPFEPEPKVVEPTFYSEVYPNKMGGTSWHTFFEEDMQQ